MRRMMHAATLLLAAASLAQAQSLPGRSLLTEPMTTNSVLAEPVQFGENLEQQDARATQMVGTQIPLSPHVATPAGTLEYGGGAYSSSYGGGYGGAYGGSYSGSYSGSYNGSYSGGQGGSQPYSQLAGYMNCSDWRPNMWNNYASERAAIVNQISVHLDMQCKCFEGKHCLHSAASGADCGSDACGSGACGSGTCKAGCGIKAFNRYKQPISSFYDTPSNSNCGGGCFRKGGLQVSTVSPCSTGCGEQGCVGNAEATQLQSHPSSARLPLVPHTAKPPRDRVASPVFGRHQAQSPNQPIATKYEARR